MIRFKYTEQHLTFLRKGYLSMTTCELTKAFNDRFGLKKTELAIKAALKRYKIRCGRAYGERLITKRRLFSEDQEAFIRETYKEHTIKELTSLFNKYFHTDFTYQQMKTFVFNHKIRSERTGKFCQGHQPWNAGTKGLGLTSANRGSFRKGNIPGNTRPVLSERIDSRDGRILIKINEKNPYAGASTRFKPKQVYVWEQVNGPVPEGKVVAFKDSDPANCNPDNLMLISRALLLELNRRKYKKMPPELKPSILAVSKLRVKISEVQ